jgi:hypothetical protein
MVHDAFFRDRDRIPSARFCEIAFADLERDPVGQVRLIYERLGLAGFNALRPKLQRYVDSLAGYQKNEFTELPEPLQRRIAREWQRSFDEWKYPTGHGDNR